MLKIFKKYISDNTGFLIRLDDIAENMDWKTMDKVTFLFDECGVKPVLGVIPNNKDPELLAYPKKNTKFWDQVREWEKKGWEIAMHGNNHLYDKFCSKTDYLGLGGNSEFCNHTFENQIKKIREGLNKFENENIKIKIFFAPNHTFDENTILALKKCGINEVLDGYGLMPYEENGVKFIPQLFYKLYTIPFGIQTFQIHLNYLKNQDFENLEKFIKKNSKKIITYQQAINKLTNNTFHKIIRISLKKALQIKRLIW
jgi:predicted deacetylase